jgi:hypothetical protein
LQGVVEGGDDGVVVVGPQGKRRPRRCRLVVGLI